MNPVTVSVIIPTYNGARFLSQAIQSVLDQTYPHFELIVVDDQSNDSTPEVVSQFDDPRLKYILHEKNRGAIAARYTGSLAAKGKIVAFLDQDDFYHPEKLQVHIDFHARHTEAGLTYNARFNLNHSAETIRSIVNPPAVMTLVDLILGFPIAPSEMVLKREWAIREDIWDDNFITQGEEVIVNGGEYVFLGRLFLAGCQFGNVGRVLNYRRYHSGRIFSNLDLRCKSEITCQNIVLTDPRCPVHVMDLRDLAHMNTKFMFAYYAFVQNEFELAQTLTQEIVQLNPQIIAGNPSGYMEMLLSMAIDDENTDHEQRLRHILDDLPTGLAFLTGQYEWAVATGYLVRGSRAIIWGTGNGEMYFARAVQTGAEISSYFKEYLVDQIVSYEAEYGSEAAHTILRKLHGHLEKTVGAAGARSLNGLLLINQAFRCYKKGEYSSVPGKVMRAISNDPKHLANKGVLAITLRSFLRRRMATAA